MSAAQAIELAHQHGVELEPRGELLHYRADAQPPPEVVEALRANKAEILAVLADQQQSAPDDWYDGHRRLLAMPAPGDISPDEWRIFIRSCGAFLSSPWAERAASLGWGAFDLFGCDPKAPLARVDRMGLLWLLRDNSIVALTDETAITKTPSGSRLTFRVRTSKDAGAVLAWELG